MGKWLDRLEAMESGYQVPTEFTLEELATRKLEQAAGGHPIDDLLNWYRDDLMEITRADMKTVGLWVEDYLENRDTYRRLQAGDLH